MKANLYNAAPNWTLALIAAIAVLILLTQTAGAAPEAYSRCYVTRQLDRAGRITSAITRCDGRNISRQIYRNGRIVDRQYWSGYSWVSRR